MGTWNYQINDEFAHAYGADAAVKFIELIGSVAGSVRPGDREGAHRLIEDGLGHLGWDFPKKSIDQLAENLTLAEHDRVIITDSRGAELGAFALPGGAGVTEPERHDHVAPDSEERPSYS